MSITENLHTRYEETPTLNSVSRDLTLMALEGEIDPIIGRTEELERVMQTLVRRAKNNPVLLGPSGIGKTRIVEGLVLRILAGTVPESLQNCRVVSLDTGLLTVGTKFRGDFEDRLMNIMHEVTSVGDLLVVVDDIHMLMRSNVTEGSLSAANVLKPMLARGEFRCIGTSTLDDYRKHIEADAALERRFQPIRVTEPDARETLAILRGVRENYELFHQVQYTDRAIQAAERLSSRYIHGRAQPDKAIDLLDEVAARKRVQLATPTSTIIETRRQLETLRQEKQEAIGSKDFPLATELLRKEQNLYRQLGELEEVWQVEKKTVPQIDEVAIADLVEAQTKIPVARLDTQETQQLVHLEQDLHQRVIGQDPAVEALARAMRRVRTNVSNNRRPIGSFLFVGPTGVGKTELARALASTLYGDDQALIKLDMSEFMEQSQVARLIGSPPGYVGHDHAGQLIEAVKRRPASVVLFDEFEKANSQIWDLLLQILDEGRLTSAQGQTVDFRHTVIILTSNIGSAHLQKSSMSFLSNSQRQNQAENDYDRMKKRVLSEVQMTFRPEFLNRLDDTIVFHSLRMEHLLQIVDQMIAGTQQRLAEQDKEMVVTEAARHWLVEHGYQAEYGARAIRRTVQHELEDMLAEYILVQGESAEKLIAIDAHASGLRITQKEEVTVPQSSGHCTQVAD